MDAQKRQVDLIIGRGLLGAETIAAELRRRLSFRLGRQRHKLTPAALTTMARQVLAEFEPLLAQALFDAEIAAWITGVKQVADQVPATARERLLGWLGGEPPENAWDVLYGGEEPVVWFPATERAAAALAKRQVLPRHLFDELAATAKQQTFTVAQQDSTATLEKIRDTLADLVAEGPTLREFRGRLEQAMITSPLGLGHIETVYRTNVATAYSQGRDELAQNPIVAELFPFQEYLPIDDARVRPEHLALGKLGLGGTGVYYTSDPFWDVFTPPISYNCRCGVNLLTVEAAARRGVHEARQWLRTGRPPLERESRLPHIPFRPDPGWGQRPRLKVA